MSPLVTAVTMCWGVSEQVVTPQTAAVHLCTETQCSNSLAAQMSTPSFDVISASHLRWVFHFSALRVTPSPSGRSHLFALIVLVINSPVCVSLSLCVQWFIPSLQPPLSSSPVTTVALLTVTFSFGLRHFLPTSWEKSSILAFFFPLTGSPFMHQRQ